MTKLEQFKELLKGYELTDEEKKQLIFDFENNVEIWLDIEGHEGVYQVSSHGRVKSLERTDRLNRLVIEKILKPQNDEDGYKHLSLARNGSAKTRRIHQLVAKAFLLNPDNHGQVNHMNWNISDNNVSNLEWVSTRENNSYRQAKKTSKYIGVCWNKDSKKWVASINLNGKLIRFGYFDVEEDARDAYLNALKENDVKNKYATLTP